MSNTPIKISERTKELRQSGIRAASQRCAELQGINLGQGVCDLPPPAALVTAAQNVFTGSKNLYSACEGVLNLREQLAHKMRTFNHITVDPKTEIMVSHGATGAYVSAVNTLFNPGDEVILFQPFYGYHKNILELFGVSTRVVNISLEDFSIDLNEVQQAIGPKTRGMVICTPNNPTGKVFTRDELAALGELSTRHHLAVITDEIYEYITYPDHEHISLASMDKFRDRTITISGFSKTYNMTGWRLGYAAGPADIIAKMALVQDLIYVCPVTPLQHALVAAFSLPQSYYDEMRAMYLQKRDLTVSTLRDIGFRVTVPQGAYYLMANLQNTPYKDDMDAMEQLLNRAKVATVVGRSFYQHPEAGVSSIRFCYAVNDQKIAKALKQIRESI